MTQDREGSLEIGIGEPELRAFTRCGGSWLRAQQAPPEGDLVLVGVSPGA